MSQREMSLPPEQRNGLSSSLHARTCAFVDAFEAGAPSPEAFDTLACDIARFQALTTVGFARLCRARRLDPTSLARAEDVPAVPTDAFKLTRVATFPEAETQTLFRTSGTTLGARGVHAMRTVGTYDRASIAFGKAWLARDLDKRVPVLVLGPSPDELPDSSLVHMCASFAKAFGRRAERDATFLVKDGVIDLGTFDERVSYALADGVPVLVLGTSFAFVHLLDALGDEMPFPLPAGSRVMQTGGFKGKSRDVPAGELRAALAETFATDERAIVAEYGMTELSSQFYERTLFDEAARHGTYVEPPWARVVPVDPVTLAPVPDGEVGLAKIVDLANVDSAVAVLAQDRVRRVPGGFELLGRAPGTAPRGCSIAIDEILGRTGEAQA
jgi:hypothetical protein